MRRDLAMRRRLITLLVIVLIALLLALLFFFWQSGSGRVSHAQLLAASPLHVLCAGGKKSRSVAAWCQSQV